MKTKNFRVELRDVSTADKPGRCKITIYNDSQELVDSPEIHILNTGHYRKMEVAENFDLTSKADAELITGMFTDKKTIPAAGSQEFIITSTPAITKDNYPKDFYLGFRSGDKITAPFFAEYGWENTPDDKAQYANATVTLTNNLSTLEDPFLTFETVKGETLTDSSSEVDIDPSGHGVITIDDNQDVHYMEFSGGSPKNQLKKGKRIIKLGVNRGSYPLSKALQLPTRAWVGFELSVAFIPC